ncbi:MAG: RNA polymerase subunit sigma-70, partial [Proteobacteria bacterium]
MNEEGDKNHIKEVSEIEILPAKIEDGDEVDESAAPAEEPSQGGVSDLVVYDPLRAYLRELSAYPPLSKEEERDLAIRYSKHKDLDAAYKLVTSNLWLVVKIARDYERAARSLLDL